MHIKLWRQWCTELVVYIHWLCIYTDMLLGHVHIVACLASSTESGTNRLFCYIAEDNCSKSQMLQVKGRWSPNVASDASKNRPVSFHTAASACILLHCNTYTSTGHIIAFCLFVEQDSLSMKITFICNVLRHIQPGEARDSSDCNRMSSTYDWFKA